MTPFTVVLSTLGVGGLLGYFAGHAVKTMSRMAGCLLGVLFILMQLLAYYGLAQWNWDVIGEFIMGPGADAATFVTDHGRSNALFWTPASGEAYSTALSNVVKNGADAAMVTCTSVNEAAAYARRFSQIPVLNIDEPVARMAVAAGTRIGVLATLPTSPKATIRLLETEAARQGKAITTVPLVAEGAYDILIAGDRAKHDEMVNDALFRLAKQVDVITFAQISMSLVPHGDCGVPLFKIGRSGFDEVKQLMGL